MTQAISQQFRDAFRNHPAGIAILTATGPDGPAALTVSSLISVSADPPVVAFSLSGQSGTAQALLAAGSLVIHLPRHGERALAELCAMPGRDRFSSDVSWEYLPTGEPRYKQIGSWFRAEVEAVTPVEGATLVAAHLVDGHMADDLAGDCADTLVYHQRQWRRLDPSAPIPPTGHKSLSSSYLDLWA